MTDGWAMAYRKYSMDYVRAETLLNPGVRGYGVVSLCRRGSGVKIGNCQIESELLHLS